MRISLLNHRRGDKNSSRAIKIAVDESLKHKSVLFAFNNYHASSFHSFNMLLKKEGIYQYNTRHISIVFDKLLLMERHEVDRWCDANVKSNIDILMIDTLNTSTGRYKKTKKLETPLANLEYLQDKLNCDVIALYTGQIPHHLNINLPIYKG